MPTLLADQMPPPAPLPALIRDCTPQSFTHDVVEESKEHLVLLDFWAPWCGPCKQLLPALEKLVPTYKGAVILVKVNIDECPEIAQQMRVQSVPTVYALFQGQPVDGFMGAQTPSQLKSWIDELIKKTGVKPKGVENYGPAISQALELMNNGDIPTAHSIFSDILSEDPLNVEAYAGLARCLIELKALEDAQTFLDEAPEEIAKSKDLIPVRAALELALSSKDMGNRLELEQKVIANPDDYQAMFDLAVAYYASGEKEKAVDTLLSLIQKNRTWNEAAARVQLLKILEALGFDDPLAIEARRRLSAILFS